MKAPLDLTQVKSDSMGNKKTSDFTNWWCKLHKLIKLGEVINQDKICTNEMFSVAHQSVKAVFLRLNG